MTRGRRPVNAIDEAVEIARRRGNVEQVTGKRDCAFDFIIIEPERERVCESETFADIIYVCLEILQRYQREIANLHRIALDQRNSPGILGAVSKRDMAVLSDSAKFSPGDPCQWHVYPL